MLLKPKNCSPKKCFLFYLLELHRRKKILPSKICRSFSADRETREDNSFFSKFFSKFHNFNQSQIEEHHRTNLSFSLIHIIFFCSILNWWWLVTIFSCNHVNLIQCLFMFLTFETVSGAKTLFSNDLKKWNIS